MAAGESPINPGALKTRAPGLEDSDEDSVVGARLAIGAPISRSIGLGALSRRAVLVGEGRTLNLGEATRRAFSHHDLWRGEVSRLGRGILAGRPQLAEEVLEFEDAYAVVRTTRVVVARPRELARVSGTFAAYLGSVRPTSPPALSSLKPEALARMRVFLRDELPTLSADDPLKAAAARGEEALLAAIAEGQGTLEIVDTLVVPKATTSLIGGTVRGMAGSFPTRWVGKLSRSLDGGSGGESKAGQDRGADEQWSPPHEIPRIRESGRHRFETEFLTGFTKAGSWIWERRWRFPSGFFRITLGASWAVGLRVPLKVSGHVDPTRILTQDVTDRPGRMTVKIAAKPINGDAGFYQRAGLSPDLVRSGKEALLEGRLYYGLKLRALWETVAHIRNKWREGIDYSQDLEPPPGGPGKGPVIAVPPEMTNTSLSPLPGLRGSAQIGLRLTGQGTTDLQYTELAGGQPVASRKLHIDALHSSEFDSKLPAMSRAIARTGQTYGFSLRDPVFRLDLKITPTVRIDAHVGVSWLSRHFTTGWMDIDGLSVDLGKVALGRHGGTPREFRWEGGHKDFKQIEAWDGAIASGDIVTVQNVVNGRYWTIAATPDSNLRATSAVAGALEKFRLQSVGQGRFAFQSCSSGRYVRGGIGRFSWLGASSNRVSAWETFLLTKLDDGTYSIKSLQNGKFVRGGATRIGDLAAQSTAVRAWEKFKIWPLERPGQSGHGAARPR